MAHPEVTVPVESPPVEIPPGPRISRSWWVVGPALALLLVATIALLVREVPYIVFMPGSATEVQPLVTITGRPGEEAPFVDAEVRDDEILFTTVSIRYPTGFEVLYRTLDDRNDIAPSEPYLGTQSNEESREFNLSLMTSSKDKAAKVALEAAGYEVTVTPTGAVIVNLDPSYPAASVLRPGDTIVGADGEPVAVSDDLVAAIAEHEPGDMISLELERLNQPGTMTVEAELAEHPEKAGQAQLGVSLENRPSYEFPFDVAIDSGDVGGPSAGLAFTLAILDRITPGDLTGGARVAVTGTIELDGTVGPVGGVKQKTEAAVSEGAVQFLVPSDEYDEAVEAADGRIEIRRADSLDQALTALEELGGDPVEPVSP